MPALGQTRPIGLDIGHHSIKIIQLAVDNGRISVVAADKVKFDPSISSEPERRDDFAVSAIKEILAKGRFHGRDVISCVPNEDLKIKNLRLDVMEGDQIEQILEKEIAQRFGLDINENEINYIIAGNVQQGDETKNELILFAADSESIKRHITLLQKAGLKPVAIDTLPCALFRSFQRFLQRVEDKDVVNVFVDIGSRFTTVVIGRGRDISFIKQILIGGEKFDIEIAVRLGIGIDKATKLRAKLKDNNQPHSIDSQTRQVIIDAMCTVIEELAREISLCLRYYTVTFRGKRLERAIFAGGEAYEGILMGALRRQLAVEPEIAQPLRGCDITNVQFEGDRRSLLCEWAVAVGLSLKGCNAAAAGMRNYERN